MSADLRERCEALVSVLGLGGPGDIASVEPLAGGVSSDIARVRVGSRDICVKFALPKLRVAEDWRAPVHRNAAEYAWLEAASGLIPGGGVRLLGRSERQHGFAMEFLSGEDVYLWKSALLSGAPDGGEARAVGDALGRVHSASAMPGFDASPFRNRDDFRALRIEPYLAFTAERHPDLPSLPGLADMLSRGETVLVHGDVSPKNILFRRGAPVILDAECATMGDASFDPAFCLSHLALKSVHVAASRDRFPADVLGFWRAYAGHVGWEDVAGLEARVCRLLPALMLARVDGKSPVEYLDEGGRGLVRRAARRLILDPPERLSDLSGRLGEAAR